MEKLSDDVAVIVLTHLCPEDVGRCLMVCRDFPGPSDAPLSVVHRALLDRRPSDSTSTFEGTCEAGLPGTREALPSVRALLQAEVRRAAYDAYDSGDEHGDEAPEYALRYSEFSAGPGVVRWDEGAWLTRRRISAADASMFPGGVSEVELFKNWFESRFALDDFVAFLKGPLCRDTLESLTMSDCAFEASHAAAVVDAIPRAQLRRCMVVVRECGRRGVVDVALKKQLVDAVERLSREAPHLAVLEVDGLVSERLDTVHAAVESKTWRPGHVPNIDRSNEVHTLNSLRRVATTVDAAGQPLFPNLAAALRETLDRTPGR